MLFLYNTFIRVYYGFICIAALWNGKAREWLRGRKGLFSRLQEQVSANDKIIWVHCSSAGEFEQGKPLIETLKIQYPDHKILLSFFSPSGYKVANHYKHVDVITYLPLDTSTNAKRFIELVQPRLIIFVKYEFWYHHLAVAAFKHIPVLLVSAVFRKEQVFFKSYGRFYKAILFLFRHIFVQDESSLQLLQKAGITHAGKSGDTRFDRVKEISNNFIEVPRIAEFVGNDKAIVAGSTWPEDEKILSGISDKKIIIAPHEITASHLSQIEKQFENSIRYSQIQNKTGRERVLIIDNVGMLSRLYYYATIAYVGGGFTKDGIHNILEAAVYGKPVLFGPNYKKYREAIELLNAGGAFSITNAEELKKALEELVNNQEKLHTAEKNAARFIQDNTGATQKIFQFIQENRLLTR